MEDCILSANAQTEDSANQVHDTNENEEPKESKAHLGAYGPAHQVYREMRGQILVTLVLWAYALEVGTVTISQYWQYGLTFTIIFLNYLIIAILKEKHFVNHSFTTFIGQVLSLLCIPFQGFVHMAEYFYLEVVIQLCTQICSLNIITSNTTSLHFKMFFEEIHFPRRQN